MENDWASENLQVIRTLMERSALYRRALAPILIYVGVVGLLGGLAGWFFQISAVGDFVLLWACDAALALTGSFLLVRRQALKDSESFWSPPTRRVACAFTPAIYVGAFLGLVISRGFGLEGEIVQMTLVVIWTWLFGCAAVSAGFFLPRGFKYFGWLFIAAGSALTCWIMVGRLGDIAPSTLMAAIFGGFHLAFGVYLYFTEKQHPAA
jgi:hypothetical protein